MKTTYFCAYHAERLKACESEAFRHWGEMMRRGVQAYVECRMDAAGLYLGTALEIGLLRRECNENGVFAVLHILKPAQFLVELFLLDRQQRKVEELINKISTHGGQIADPLLDDFLSQSFNRAASIETSCGKSVECALH